MDQVDLALEQIERKYRLELKCLKLQSQNAVLLKQIPQALLKQREADEKLRIYENGSLRAFIHKMSGNYESRVEEYRRASRLAAGILEQLQREQQMAESEIVRIQEELSALSDCETQLASLRQSTDPLHQQALRKYSALTALFHGNVAIYYLEENKKYLLAARNSMKAVGQPRLQTAYDRDQALEQADRCANALREHILEYNRCQACLEREHIPMGEYFESPTAYIVGVVAEWEWLNRINYALEQIAQMQSILQRQIESIEQLI